MVIDSDDNETSDAYSQSETDYNFNCSSSDLLSQWLNSLETRSSLFWLHYVECNYNQKNAGKKDFCEDSDEGEELSLTNSSDSGLENSNSFTDNDTDDKDSNKNLPILPECKSIAHRDSELLLALTENCSHGPVCYFCRYNCNDK